ncbi:hypothetical protein QBC46DRAFT_401200 [Diplogelasinospora grovesii]|uniref:DUF676 domain-containing protein n=1 Tax=Diplogelasinospora grovesii TaxID=303347 RepID=A0AAN6MUP2_9PEZI|nr:hypothetical protein QBC46DRAFT_401200 [Diplogelasinospora grovesii]
MHGEAVSRNFLRELVRPGSPNLDIVAVHGLNPFDTEFHAEQTWTTEGQLWLKDFLPQRLPRARVLLFGYNSNVAFRTSVSGVREQAENLLARLKLARLEAPDRPILFICHSLGGIVVKRALVDAAINVRFQDIRKATYGIVFFGTPHQGGNLIKLGSVASKIVRAVLRQPSNSFLAALERDSLFADDLTRDFRHQLEDYHILSFYESLPYGKLGVIVDRKSATLGLPGAREQQIDTGSDHVDMCKFVSSDGDDYVLAIGCIGEIADSAVEDHQKRSSATSENVPSTELTCM